MTEVNQCDRKWCHSLMLYCPFDVVNDIVSDLHSAKNAVGLVSRNGEWCCAAGKKLEPSEMGEVFRAVVEDEPARQLLSEKVIQMLRGEAVPA